MIGYEVEFKYDAKNIDLKDFHKFCKKKAKYTYISQTGTDVFYSHKEDKDVFYRYRKSPDLNQLTFKRKIHTANSFMRIEHNIDLAGTMDEDRINLFCEGQGFTYNCRIFKTAFTYFYGPYVMTYYICYDESMKELGRFMEVEASEDGDIGGPYDQLSYIQVIEKSLRALGITDKDRLTKSLFEMYRKD